MSWEQIFSILLTALLTLVVAVVAQRFIEKKADLRYRIHSTGDLVPSNSKVPLVILYNGQQVSNLVQLQVEFINRGKLPIEKSAHNVLINWKVPRGTIVQEIADQEKVQMYGFVDDAGVEQRVGSIVLLNEGESSTMEFLITGEPEPTIEVTARGVGVVAKPDRVMRLSSRLIWLMAALMVPGLVLFGFAYFAPSPELAQVTIALAAIFILIGILLSMLSTVAQAFERR